MIRAFVILLMSFLLVNCSINLPRKDVAFVYDTQMNLLATSEHDKLQRTLNRLGLPMYRVQRWRDGRWEECMIVMVDKNENSSN